MRTLQTAARPESYADRQSMKFQVQLTEDDFVASRWLAMRPRFWLQVTGWIVLATLLFGTSVGVNEAVHKRSIPVELWWVIGGIVYVAIWFLVLMPWRLKKIFLQQKSLQRPFELEFTDAHLSVVAENGQVTLVWSDFVKWKKNKKMILLYQSDALAHLIPLRAFSTDGDCRQVEELLKAKLGEQKA